VSAERFIQSRFARSLVVLIPLSLGACEWFSDFKEQPKVDPWESPSDTVAVRGNPQFSVPTTGTAVAGFEVSYAQTPAAVDSMSGLQNPTPPSPASIANGHRYYAINCAVCHGDDGAGTKNMALAQYGFGINIVSATTRARSDGYIFGMIRNGRGLMPSYNRIEEMDRWDVVNYLRGLQGSLPGVTVARGPLGRPGETGAMLPGATQLGPTRPVPHYRGRGAGDSAVTLPAPVTGLTSDSVAAAGAESHSAPRTSP